MNFEEYIKKPFEDQEFEFKEAYWQSAEKLIDNHYKRVRWIRAGIICSVLIATFIAAYFFLQTKETNIPVTALAQEQNLNPNNKEQENSTKNIQTPTSEENLTPLNSDSETSGSISAKTNTEKIQDKSEDSGSMASASIANNSKNSIPSRESDFSNKAKSRTSASSKTSSKSTGSGSKAIVSANNSSSKSDINIITPNPSNNKASVGLTTPAFAEKVQEKIPNESTPSSTESINTETASASSISQSKSTSALDLPFRNIEVSNSLQLLDFPLHLDFAAKRPIIALPRPSRLYATAELLMYPSGNSEAFKFLGFNAGFGYQQPLGRMAFIDFGVSGSFRRGNFAPSIVSTQLNYDFGPRSDAYILRPQSLFSLQVPILFGIESGRHMVSAGVKLGFLIGVRGTSEYANYTHAFESPTGKESYSYDVVDEGWIESTGFKKFALAYALKYQYRLSSRIMIGATLQYFTSDWTANDFGQFYNFTSNEYQNPTGNPAQLIERNWLLGVELKYVLFSKY
ncbi:MAG: hypothetical protein IPI60_00810 [Saprospiraceae bacterium]|nr:hypothetical protein [Saprospiraceae bacterium]